MKLVCGPSTSHPAAANGALRVILYGQATEHNHGSAGEAIKWDFYRRRLEAAPRAWDLLSIALSVITADFAGKRAGSSDGWTRDFELDIAVGDPDFWDTQANAIVRALGFLTTDRWRLNFHDGGYQQVPTQAPARSGEDCVVLLSGGLDSLIGAVDLAASGKKPLAVSQRVRGDAAKQSDFAGKIGGGLKHLQLNHNASATGDEEASQRARSLIFIALGVLAATTLQRYYKGGVVPLYVCENGFIALNPPLTGSRLGSLSTRTAHPEFLGRFQAILSAAGLRVEIRNPYQARTKGEMLVGCSDQLFLTAEAARTTSCGRFQRFSYTHCGRCVPCQVRRAAFITWGVPDATPYVYVPLGKRDSDHARFDDVRSVAMAIAQVGSEGLDSWLGTTLTSDAIHDRAGLTALVGRGLGELKTLHQACGVT